MNRTDTSGEGSLDDVIGLALGLFDDASPADFADFPESSEVSTIDPERVRLLRFRVAFLLDDEADDDPFRPSFDLVSRTQERIRTYESYQAEMQEPLEYRPRWRVADLAVAAAVLFAVFLGSLPALKKGQIASANLACSANLAQIWKGVELYADTFQAYPNAATHDRSLPVGAVLSLLRHTGHLSDSVPLTCPGCSRQVLASELPQWNQLRERRDEHIRDLVAKMSDVYALHPGLRSGDRAMHLEPTMIRRMRSMVPMLGDRPPMTDSFRVLPGNSHAHGGYGQNVIFADGHIIFLRGRSIRHLDSDVYANRFGECDVPIEPTDALLVPADMIFMNH